MRIEKSSIQLFVLLISTYAGIAQKIDIGKPYHDILLKNIINHKDEKALLSSFNDKPLLIDFWFIGCAPCMELVPHIDSLQKANKGKFNVLLATFEDKNTVLAFIKKHPVFQNFPIVTDIERSDSLMLMFPHTKEPHEIWIDSGRTVRAITSSDKVTSKNLAVFLNGAPLSLPEKRELTPQQRSLPLFVIDRDFNDGKGQLFYSYISETDPKISNVSWGIQYEKENNTVKARCQNCLLQILYMIAYDIHGQNKFFLTGKSWDEHPGKKEAALKSFYSYELVMRDSSIAKARRVMRSSLDNYFSLQSEVRQVEVPCYVLSRLKDSSEFISKSASPANKLDSTSDKIIVNNIGIGFVADNGLYNNLEHEVINETNYEGRITVTIPRTRDLQKLKKELRKYGLDINLENRKREMIFLKNTD
ncbi:TlpA family protein disulfide reductase [Chitinophaga oryzae]|uniref:TlpA family protein disulfide reductase n=1 Tax=Chitinophaga oryzae TaxID=2725414 RepID=A0AAE6ZD88_9BACT|nr:TlpA disulfide reductase family protein [Chitinophaga oryzae]QJB30816.1 TlpA family protein disulfide reductase [Chitinophaga oryzae]